MRLDFMRDAAKNFPEISQPLAITKLRVWNCKYKSFAKISEMKNLEELVISSLPDEDFNFVSRLENLKYLSVVHLPKIKSIEPLKGLRALTSISLATSPSWDAANRTLEIESLQPLSELKGLRHIELFGVRPLNGSLKVLESLTSLETARFSKYQQDEVDRFFRVTSAKMGFNPKSSF